MPRSGKTAATPQDLVPKEDRSGPNPAFDAEAYNAVARAAKLRRIALFRSNFTVQPEYFAGLTADNAPKPRYSGIFSNPNFDAEKGRATCLWQWAIKSRTKQKVVLSIEVDYLVIYENLQSCAEAQVFRFMRRVGRFATYPYFRAHASQINWESGINLPVLPTIAT